MNNSKKEDRFYEKAKKLLSKETCKEIILAFVKKKKKVLAFKDIWEEIKEINLIKHQPDLVRELNRMIDVGIITKIKKGFYQLSSGYLKEGEKLFVISMLQKYPYTLITFRDPIFIWGLDQNYFDQKDKKIFNNIYKKILNISMEIRLLKYEITLKRLEKWNKKLREISLNDDEEINIITKWFFSLLIISIVQMYGGYTGNIKIDKLIWQTLLQHYKEQINGKNVRGRKIVPWLSFYHLQGGKWAKGIENIIQHSKQLERIGIDMMKNYQQIADIFIETYPTNPEFPSIIMAFDTSMLETEIFLQNAYSANQKKENYDVVDFKEHNLLISLLETKDHNISNLHQFVLKKIINKTTDLEQHEFREKYYKSLYESYIKKSTNGALYDLLKMTFNNKVNKSRNIKN